MITGYAAVFYNPKDSRTEFELGENYVERIMPGAFDKTLLGDDEVVGLFNHDPNMLLGRRTAGTLRLHVDDKGLRYEIDPADTQISRDVVALQERRDLVGSSFGFIVDDEVAEMQDDTYVREVREVTLVDVGPVTYPAYEGTNSVRYTTIDGFCMAMPAQIAAEVRSNSALRFLPDVKGRLWELERRNAEMEARWGKSS